MPSFVRIREKL